MIRLISIFSFALLMACSSPKRSPLPFLGMRVSESGDSLKTPIDSFSFSNQKGIEISNSSMKGKVFLADFIFLNCPTICPKMTSEMHDVYEHYSGNSKVGFVSYSIDPDRDTQEALNNYADMLSINSDQWHFLRGDTAAIRKLAEQSYYSLAYPDSIAPGGFTHSGGLLLVDQRGYLRAVYDGTDGQVSDRIIQDITLLLEE